MGIARRLGECQEQEGQVNESEEVSEEHYAVTTQRTRWEIEK
jgi:hypothetical protein